MIRNPNMSNLKFGTNNNASTILCYNYNSNYHEVQFFEE